MMDWTTVICFLVASFALAIPQATPPAAPAPGSANFPCAGIRGLIENQAQPQIPAQLAFDCLNDVPLNHTEARLWIATLKPYVEWQSTLAYLKNPPADSHAVPHDIMDSLDWMIENVDTYRNEYELEWALYRIFQTSGDGHLRYTPNLVGGIFQFGRPVAVVTVSLDGNSLPRPYVYNDVVSGTVDGSYQPSPISTINGQDAVSYLVSLCDYGNLNDLNGQYNEIMLNLAQISLGGGGSGSGMFGGGGRGGVVYPNATTEITFDNGTTAVYQNFARVLRNFVNITSGQDLYTRYLFSSTAGVLKSTGNGVSQQVPAPGYPTPFKGQLNNNLRGFYLGVDSYQDVAILTVGKFFGQTLEQGFQQLAFDFIAQSKAEGKTKLIVDLRANGGGALFHAYSLFTNLFPDLVPYGATRFRAQEALNIIGLTVSDVAGSDYPVNFSKLPDGPSDIMTTFIGTPFNYRADVDIDYHGFESWQEKFGPYEHHGDRFTNVIRWNLSDPSQKQVNGFVVNGYLDRANVIESRPFEAENIVLLLDGYCASACAILVEFMTQQAGVRTVAVGGVPNDPGPMQAVGGTKGTNVWSFGTIYTYARQTFELGTRAQQEAWLSTSLARLYSYPFYRSAEFGGSVNVRDGIRQGDDTQTPLQFVQQEADCRIWYEPSFTVDVTALWKRVVDVTWGPAKCIGSRRLGKKGDRVARGIRHQGRAMAVKEISQLRKSVHLLTDVQNLKLEGDAEMLP